MDVLYLIACVFGWFSSPQKMMHIILLILFFLHNFFNTLELLSAHLHIRFLLIHQDL